ncbi:MAG: hypothetical protein ACLSUW_07710 [Akkermansia sp.]
MVFGAAGCASLLHAQSVNQFPDSITNPLDSSGRLRATCRPFLTPSTPRWACTVFRTAKIAFLVQRHGSFGNASVRNEHPAFDYSAGSGDGL